MPDGFETPPSGGSSTDGQCRIAKGECSKVYSTLNSKWPYVATPSCIRRRPGHATIEDVFFSAVLAALAGGLAIGQMLPYTISSLRGITKPSRVASSINLACNLVTTLSMAAAGTRSGLVLPTAFVLTNIGTLFLAIKYGHSRFTKSDVINASLAGASLIAYLLFGPYVALISMAVVTTSSCRSVVAKLRDFPGTEDPLSWLMVAGATMASAGAIIAEGSATVGLLILPAVNLVNFIIVTVYAYGPARVVVHLRLLSTMLRPIATPATLDAPSDLVLGA